MVKMWLVYLGFPGALDIQPLIQRTKAFTFILLTTVMISPSILLDT